MLLVVYVPRPLEGSSFSFTSGSGSSSSSFLCTFIFFLIYQLSVSDQKGFVLGSEMGFLVHYNYQDILSEFCTCFRLLYVLRENFSTCSLKFLEFDVPIMALTATATIRVREDILHSLCISMETQIVLTTFFRPNLRFSVSSMFLNIVPGIFIMHFNCFLIQTHQRVSF